MATKRYGEAVKDYDAAARNGSDASLAAARYRARLAANAPRPQVPLEEWLARSPDDAAVRVLLGEHEQRLGNESAAIAAYEKVLETAPDNVVALNNLAGLYQQRGDARASVVAKRAYDAAPQSAAVQDTYGWILVESGDLAGGTNLIREAAKALPDSAEVQYHLGAALARSGQVEEARKLLDGVLAATDVPTGVRTGAEAELAKLDR
jgi:Flp pilus assembly protein TadD